MRISTEVDKIEIVKCPGYRHYARIQAILDRDPSAAERGIPSRIVFRTAASRTLVSGHIYITCFRWNSDTDLYYAGIFHGQLVEGNLNPYTGYGDMQDL